MAALKAKETKNALLLLAQVAQVSGPQMQKLVGSLPVRNGNSVLLAAKNNMTQVVKKLAVLKKGGAPFSLDQSGPGMMGQQFTPLEWAIYNANNSDMVTALVDAGAYVSPMMVTGARYYASIHPDKKAIYNKIVTILKHNLSSKGAAHE